MLAECRAVLDKEGRRKWGTGRFEVVFWAQRLVYVDATAILYQAPRRSRSDTAVTATVLYQAPRHQSTASGPLAVGMTQLFSNDE